MKILDYSEIKRLPESVARQGCIVLNMPNEVYQNFAGLSKSGADKIDISPAAFKKRAPFKTSRAVVVGSALHASLLEPHVFEEQYQLMPEVEDRRKAEYKKLAEMYGADNVLVKSECENIAAMTENARLDREVDELLKRTGISEVSFFATCPETGVLLRCRFDRIDIETDRATDLKKTRDASPEGFSKSVGDYRYHVQQQFYSYVYRLVTGRDLKKFTFVAIQETAPHTVRKYELDEEARVIGDYYFHKNLETYADCMLRDIWPHAGKNGVIGLQYWHVNEYEKEIDELNMDEFQGSDE
ncbi:MAG: PD-(D/E)XK nuclease-like domain-containing protein [Pseudoalteromonas sp.]